MEERALKPESPGIVHWDFPASLRDLLGETSPDRIDALGNLDLLSCDLLAVFCSVKAPGSIILQAHDLAQELKSAAFPIISGFHSPVEREMLRVLLCGKQPVVICPARNIGSRIRAEHKQALEEGRLVFLSPFNEKQRRATAEMAQYRNRLIAALATSVFVAYATPSGHTERLCQEIIARGKPLYTLNNPANENLIALGARLMPDCPGHLW